MRGRRRLLTLSCASGLAIGGVSIASPPATASDRLPAARAVEGDTGIRWEESLKAARAKARRAGKPLLILHMFGKLTEPFC